MYKVNWKKKKFLKFFNLEKFRKKVEKNHHSKKVNERNILMTLSDLFEKFVCS